MNTESMRVMIWLVALLLLVVFVIVVRKKKPGSALIVGPCGAGKTLLFERLQGEEVTETVTSMRPNLGQLGDLRLVDYPGHYRLRNGLSEETKKATRVIFLVDGAATQAKPAAELLFGMLCQYQAAKYRPPILFVGNKNGAAKSPQRLMLMMMNEIETLRKTRGALDDDPIDSLPIGVPGKPFSFDLHSPCPVTFVSIDIKASDLETITDFLFN